ncbi:uncharacterized protein LOC111674140 [Orussus abietinus]|uniref:uncharacterized protein LOC111674140 n=1 Tax=Orussus abietinus TaxID=222816 RepID=UPI000C7161F3|nr:uncharacterized protein LOC111674140 [Orussus abietinus]
MMSEVMKDARDFTVPELKAKLKATGQSTSGTKAELINRLLMPDPSGAWMNGPREEIQDGDREEQRLESRDEVDFEETRNRRRGDERHDGDRRGVDDRHDGRAASWREIELFRKEKELAERELALARKEIEFLQRGTTVDVSEYGHSLQRDAPSRIGVSTIAELLNNFDGSSDSYERWEKQVQLLRSTYRLADPMTKILIGSRLKGRAFEWFHSKAGHLEMTTNDLLAEMRKMFFHRINRVAARKLFEERHWKRGEVFGDYLHDKIILANRVPIEEIELIDYVIDGVPDPALRDQARMQRFDSTAALLQSFEKIVLRPKTSPATSFTPKTDSRAAAAKTRESFVQRDGRHCYNCLQVGHVAARCPAKKKGTRCFRRHEHGHVASRCSRDADPTKEANTIRFLSDNKQSPRGKTFKDVKIGPHCVKALLDTDSDISLMRMDQYKRIGAPQLRDESVPFGGVGLVENRTLGTFYETLMVDEGVYPIAIHVIPDELMNYQLLIGSDFLNTVNVSINEGKATISAPICNSPPEGELPQIFLIDDVREVDRVDVSHVANREYRQRLLELVDSYKPMKARETEVKMTLVLKDDEPVFQRPRRLSASQRENVNKQIAEWMKEGIVRPSLSDYASPIVTVKKKNGTERVCVDYRMVNRKIVKDRYPLPLIEDHLDSLQGAKVFSTLDLKNGFFHVTVDKDSRKYTAFVVPDGQYEFLKVPFGLCNSPSVFQRYINSVFRELITAKIVLVYMDDLVVPSADCLSGLKALEMVLATAEQYGLLINWKKCRLLQSKVEYLGYIVENGSIRPSEYKTKAVMEFPRPINVKAGAKLFRAYGLFSKIYSWVLDDCASVVKFAEG